MDLLKWIEAQHYTKEEVSKEAAKTLNIFSKPLLNKEDHERFMNLKDLQLSRLKTIGMIKDDEAGHAYLVIVTKINLDRYWEQIDLPNKERDIYKFGCTDKQLKYQQNKYLKQLQKKLKDYENVIAEWWQQRADEDEMLSELKPKSRKLNGTKK